MAAFPAFFIKVKVIREIILKAIKEVTAFAKEEEFLKTVHTLSDEKQKEKLMEKRKIKYSRRKKLRIKYSNRQTLWRLCLKKITGKQFERLFKKYDEKQTDTESKIKTRQEEIYPRRKNKTDGGKFLKMLKKHTGFETLTNPMLNEYIEKVIAREAAGERKGKDGKQEAYIYFNFIANMEINGYIEGRQAIRQ